MLQFNPKKRISALEALKHEYFQDIFDPEQLQTEEKFDFSFEKDIESVGCKKILYNSIIEFKKKLKKKEKLTVEINEKDNNTSIIQSPIHDLLQDFKKSNKFKDEMDETE